MNHPETILKAFRDELEKISGTGMSRIGRPPVTVANALRGKGKFFKGMGKTVLSAAAPAPGKFGYKSIGAAALSGAALGALGLHKGKKMYEDYQTGKAVRQAQGPGSM